MELILWRHAEAEIGEPDAGRVLTAKGHKQAWKMAEWFDANLPDRCRILVSPATRAVQTAEAQPTGPTTGNRCWWSVTSRHWVGSPPD